MDKDTKILIADENAEVRNGCRSILGAKGADIDECRSGEEAVRMMTHRTYDIVITDLWLPGIDAAGIIAKSGEKIFSANFLYRNAFIPVYLFYKCFMSIKYTERAKARIMSKGNYYKKQKIYALSKDFFLFRGHLFALLGRIYATLTIKACYNHNIPYIRKIHKGLNIGVN